MFALYFVQDVMHFKQCIKSNTVCYFVAACFSKIKAPPSDSSASGSSSLPRTNNSIEAFANVAFAPCYCMWGGELIEQNAALIHSRLNLFQGNEGGLGLFHIKHRALAALIITFLQTAINPNFRRKYYHESLFNNYVLGVSQPSLKIPIYFMGKFFPTLRNLREKRSECDWFQVNIPISQVC